MSPQRPHLTVATVVEQDGQLLMVRERTADGLLVYNQPAGHVEDGETLLEAAVRETLEETAWRVKVTALLGIYHYTAENNGITYVRICFIATPQTHLSTQALDTEIESALWLTPVEIAQRSTEMRSPLVLAAIRDYQAGISYPLAILSNF